MVRRWLGPAHLLILPSLAAGTALSRKKSLRDMDLGGHCPPGSGTLPPKPLSGIREKKTSSLDD